MAIKNILLLGNPQLRVKCPRVKDFSDPEIRSTMNDLSDTLSDFRRRKGFGRGIAAPQIGSSLRILFLNLDEPFAMINPMVTKQSRQMMTLWDDCFSFPDILVKVKRSTTITIRFQDESGKRNTLTAEGSLSELLQHEIDHLDGILAIDRAVDSKHIILRSEWKKLMEHHFIVPSL